MVAFIIWQPFLFGTVSGNSMEPTLSDGDRFIYLTGVTPEEGDIIIFDYSESLNLQEPDSDALVIHRVVDVRENSYITIGDANSSTDDPVDKSDYRGTLLLAVDTTEREIVYFHRELLPL